MALLAKKMKKLASIQFLNLKVLINGRSFSKFKKQYRLKGELGRGGFGIVYRAIRIADETPVAVKFIERKHVREWAKLNDERVPMEICMLARCTRITGVIRLLDWYSIPEGFIIIMERPYPCIDLFDFIRSQGRLNEDLARYLFRQVAQTIVECACKKVLHRDVKDENVVIDLVSGETRLIDFGAATLLNKTHYSDFQGTRLYCPPEWFLHSIYLGTEAAVWSLGILLYNMLNGRLPFRNEKDICTSHLLGPLPFYTSLSPEAKDLIERCLRFEPFTRCTLQEILAHPWVRKPTADWLVLTAGGSNRPTAEQQKLKGDKGDSVAKPDIESVAPPTAPPNSHNSLRSTSYAESGVGSASSGVASSISGASSSKSASVAEAAMSIVNVAVGGAGGCSSSASKLNEIDEAASRAVVIPRRDVANTTMIRGGIAGEDGTPGIGIGATSTTRRCVPKRIAKTNSVNHLVSTAGNATTAAPSKKRTGGGIGTGDDGGRRRLHRKSTFDSGIVSAVFSTFRKAFSKEHAAHENMDAAVQVC